MLAERRFSRSRRPSPCRPRTPPSRTSRRRTSRRLCSRWRPSRGGRRSRPGGSARPAPSRARIVELLEIGDRLLPEPDLAQPDGELEPLVGRGQVEGAPGGGRSSPCSAGTGTLSCPSTCTRRSPCRSSRRAQGLSVRRGPGGGWRPDRTPGSLSPSASPLRMPRPSCRPRSSG